MKGLDFLLEVLRLVLFGPEIFIKLGFFFFDLLLGIEGVLDFEAFKSLVLLFIAFRAFGLPFRVLNIFLNFKNDISKTFQIFFGTFKLSKRFIFFCFVFRDSCGLFDQKPAFFRVCLENVIDPTLFNHGIGR